MGDRILMQLAGQARPLSFGARGPLLMSAATPWAGAPVEVHRMQSVEVDGTEAGPLDREHGLLVILDGQIDIVVRKNGRDLHRSASAGSMAVVSGDARSNVVRLVGSAEALAVHVSPAWLGRLGLATAAFPLRPTAAGERDPTALALGQAMRDEIARGAPSGALFAESLSLALLSYASQRATEAPFEVREGLSAAQRRRLAQYIREHLHEDLSVAELGAQVGLGARRFTTLFRAAFGATPHRYVLRERLNEGARLLARGDQAITDIALQTGFCSHSHFTSTFRAAFGTTPQRYARRPRWNG